MIENTGLVAKAVPFKQAFVQSGLHRDLARLAFCGAPAMHGQLSQDFKDLYLKAMARIWPRAESCALARLARLCGAILRLHAGPLLNGRTRVVPGRCRANMAPMIQSRPDSGLILQLVQISCARQKSYTSELKGENPSMEKCFLVRMQHHFAVIVHRMNTIFDCIGC